MNPRRIRSGIISANKSNSMAFASSLVAIRLPKRSNDEDEWPTPSFAVLDFRQVSNVNLTSVRQMKHYCLTSLNSRNRAASDCGPETAPFFLRRALYARLVGYHRCLFEIVPSY